MSVLTIQAEPRQTRAAIQTLFQFLSDFRNFSALLPMDKISDYQATESNCSFTISGVAALNISIQKSVPNKEIVYYSKGPAKSEVHLSVTFDGDPAMPGQCKVKLDAHMNPFLKSMAQKPLAAVVNTIAQKLAELNPQSA